jgi:phosphopantothenoylcysteine synthetase/decarboxylase
MRCLVTAGNTREMIDEVRDWGNVFTGNTGLAIARALTSVAQVDLLTSNKQHLEELARQAKSPEAINALEFSSHASLRALLASMLSRTTYDAIFMTAAVADYRPTGVYEIVERTPAAEFAEEQTWKVRRVSAKKVSSAYRQIVVAGEQTEKLVDLFRGPWAYRGMLVKFKLEVGLNTDELLRVGRQSRAASRADYLVANTLEMTQGPKAGAYVISEHGEEWVDRARLPQRMVELVRRRYTGGSGSS